MHGVLWDLGLKALCIESVRVIYYARHAAAESRKAQTQEKLAGEKAKEKPQASTKPRKRKEKKSPTRRSASAPPAKEPRDTEPLPLMDAEEYARVRKIQSMHERMARLGWVLQHRVCEYLESIE